MRRVVLIAACAAALTSSWTSIGVGGVEVGDVTLGLAFVLSVALRFLSPRLGQRFPFWLLIPTLTVIGLLWFDTVVLGQPVLRPVAVLDIGAGVSPAVFLERVAASSAVVGALLFNLIALFDVDHVFRLLWFYVVSLVVSAFYALLQSFGLSPLAAIQTQLIGIGRYPGLTSHPNALAQSAVLAACVLAGLPVRSTTGGAFRLVAGAACGYAVAVSGSRAGLIAALLILLVLVVRFVSSRSGGPLRVALIATCLVGFAYGAFALSSVTRLADNDNSADVSDTERAASVASGFHLFTASPFTGSGLGIWLGESVPVILLSSGGLILFFAYGLFLAPACSMALRSGRLLPGLRWSALLTICSLVIVWLLNNNLFERYTLWPLLALALLWRAHPQDSVPTSDTTVRARLPRASSDLVAGRRTDPAGTLRR